MENCTFIDNKGLTHGGAICVYDNVNVTSINCTFENNSAPFSGAYHAHKEGSTWIDCTFKGNKANGTGTNSGYGGAVSLLNDGSGGYRFVNCSFEDNYARIMVVLLRFNLIG